MDFDNRKVYGDTSITDGLVPLVFLLIFQTLFGLYFDLNLTYILKLEGAGGGGG